MSKRQFLPAPSSQITIQGAPRQLNRQEQCLAQAEAFAWRGEYGTALGMFRRAFFERESMEIMAPQSLCVRKLEELWAEIERNHRNKTEKRISCTFANLNMIVKKEHAKAKDAAVAKAYVDEFQRDQRQGVCTTYALGKVGMLVQLCSESRCVRASDLVRMEGFLT